MVGVSEINVLSCPFQPKPLYDGGELEEQGGLQMLAGL